MRTFDSGATKSNNEGKLDYDGFLSPLVLKRFAEYMHKHRIQDDETLRASDNWQKGIPQEEYRKSLWRHFMDTWALLRGQWYAVNQDMDHPEAVIELEESLCAMLFCVQGLLHVAVGYRRSSGVIGRVE